MHTIIIIYKWYSVHSLEFLKVTYFVKSSWNPVNASNECTVWLCSKLLNISNLLVEHKLCKKAVGSLWDLDSAYHLSPTPQWFFPDSLWSSQNHTHHTPIHCNPQTHHSSLRGTLLSLFLKYLSPNDTCPSYSSPEVEGALGTCYNIQDYNIHMFLTTKNAVGLW